MKSEKVKEIKKCLVFCKDRLCKVCPRLKQEPNQEEDCRCALIEQSLTLINELESENERLLESCKNCHYIKDLEIANGHAKELKDRIAELKKENEDYYYKLNNLQTYINNHEEIWIGNTNNALKQFTDRLKEKRVSTIMDGVGTCVVFVGDIDETLEELIKIHFDLKENEE